MIEALDELVEDIEIDEPEPPALAILTLKEDQCRWAFEDAAPYTFCCAPTNRFRSYCSTHDTRAHRNCHAPVANKSKRGPKQALTTNPFGLICE